MAGVKLAVFYFCGYFKVANTMGNNSRVEDRISGDRLLNR